MKEGEKGERKREEEGGSMCDVREREERGRGREK